MTEHMMIKGVKNGAVHFDYRWQRGPRFKNNMGPAPAPHKPPRQKAILEATEFL